MAEAAHITHDIKHSFALLGLIAGIVVGIIVAVAIVGTGGAALALVAAVCTGISIGGGLGKMIGKHIPGPTSGKLVSGHPLVYIGGKPIAFATTPAACAGQFVWFFSHPSVAAQGSATVLVGGMPFSRKGDKMTCGAVIGAGDDNVNVGGATATFLPISEEVPAWVDWALLVIGLFGGWGALRSLGFGAVQIAARLFFGTVGALGGGAGGSWLGGHLFGEGSWGQDLMGLVGGVLGGWLGFQGGARLTPARSAPMTPAEALLNEGANRNGIPPREQYPAGMKEKWSDGNYKYEVRIHPAEAQYGKEGSIYRVSRQAIPKPGQQGTGVEYMDSSGNWHPQKTLKPGHPNQPNPTYNDAAAKDTHIEVPKAGNGGAPEPNPLPSTGGSAANNPFND
jgi:uncharacterized Zn-binding protein involved in type VI secretion